MPAAGAARAVGRLLTQVVARQEPLYVDLASISAPSLMFRIASASPGPAARHRGETPEGRADVIVSGVGGVDDSAVMSAGASTTVVSSVKMRMPRTRAKIVPRIRIPSERRVLRSGIAVSSGGV